MAKPPPSPLILVVDDEPELRRMFTRVLEIGGFRSLEAHTAEDAWLLLDCGMAPAGVLLDLLMPGMGGLRFLHQLRADTRYSDLPVAVVTGASFMDEATRSAVLASGASLTFKPIHVEEILALTHSLVQRSD